VQVLAQLGAIEHPDLLAGTAGFEDAGIFRIDPERALVQTVDFFPPIVDDPRWFGRIAAANALSDVYAMGGRPLTALNIVGWPRELDVAILGEILAGGMDKLREAGVVLCGGHSVVDAEVKFGMSVTGVVHPERFWRNSGARAGDRVLLTKPVGMGAVATAIKKERVAPDVVQRAMEQMATLNAAAAGALAGVPVHAATDVTGFGLMGHGYEMADGAKLTLRLRARDVPVFEGALQLAEQGVLSGGCKRGRQNLEGKVRIAESVEAARADLFFDAETSGGLLVAVPEAAAPRAERALREAGVVAALIGAFEPRGEHAVVLE
jgi:selenide,water dikinase